MMGTNYTNAVVLEDPLSGEYPTRSQIMLEPRPFFRFGLFKVVSNWKEWAYPEWSLKDEDLRMENLQGLVQGICKVYEVPVPKVLFGDTDCYSPLTQEILLTKPSVVTTLHELAHHLFGPSEYHACRFSVWLYKLRFVSAYEKLEWHGHLLVSA